MTPSEVWLPIVGYEGFYEVSNLGQVRSYHSNNHRPGSSHMSSTPRILKQSIMKKKGYKKVVLCRPDIPKKGKLVHWLVAAAFIGERPVGLDINHINGIKDDNRAENLEYVTRQANIRHKIDVLGKGIGDTSPSAKLTSSQVLEIREIYRANSVTNVEIGKMFGVSPDAILKIAKRINWKHI